LNVWYELSLSICLMFFMACTICFETQCRFSDHPGSYSGAISYLCFWCLWLLPVPESLYFPRPGMQLNVASTLSLMRDSLPYGQDSTLLNLNGGLCKGVPLLGVLVRTNCGGNEYPWKVKQRWAPTTSSLSLSPLCVLAVFLIECLSYERLCWFALRFLL
jgi:hypothetical protein